MLDELDEMIKKCEWLARSYEPDPAQRVSQMDGEQWWHQCAADDSYEMMTFLKRLREWVTTDRQ